jgi:hypothetical protein
MKPQRGVEFTREYDISLLQKMIQDIEAVVEIQGKERLEGILLLRKEAMRFLKQS